MPDPIQPRRLSALARLRKRFLADTRGNIMVMTAIMIPAVLITLGGAVDYVSSTRREEAVDGIADAAALAATTPGMMLNSCNPSSSAACQLVVQQVVNVFNAQIGTVQGIGAMTITSANVSIVDSTTAPTTRTATVTWAGTSNNGFGGILGYLTMPIGGQSVAKNTAAPQITFYMLIDTSPSMAFPATTGGVTTMITDTPNNTGGCALGCHESDANAFIDDGMWNPPNMTCTTGTNPQFPCVTVSYPAGSTTCANFQATIPTGAPLLSGTAATASTTQWESALTAAQNTWNTNHPTNKISTNGPGTNQVVGANSGTRNFGTEDAFTLSRCLGVPLRIDYVNTAVTALMTTAPTTATENNTVYRVNLYTIDNNAATTAAGKIGLYNLYSWPTAEVAGPDPNMAANFTAAQTAAGTLAQLEIYKNGCLLAACSEVGDNDEDTNIDVAGLGGLYGIMPVPGNGGSGVGQTPEEVLFIVTDGVNDYATSGNSSYCSSTRLCDAVNSALNPTTGNKWCADIQTKGIRIAFLYLTYNPLNPNSFYIDNVQPYQPSIATAAQNCASAGLYFEVNTDQDITGAMQALFQKAIQTAYLAH